ncbi:UNVERIFIED_CONTAM: hypothetical protein GTU68_016494 [Idotea baltica]|nr:hypothetical protein [Idotea baltica]
MSIPVTITRIDVPSKLRKLHKNKLANRLLNARGVESAEELKFALADLPRPDTLLGIEAAVDRLLAARTEQQKVLIVGDYDCDGATSTCLALLALRAMGFKHVEYLVPNRFDYGYGLSPAIVDVAAKSKPDLIVTVDNGVASVDGVERATELNIDVVVTDHHLPPAVLPRAVALVNPNIPGATFPSGNLAGVGVCFYVLLALRARLAKEGIDGGDVKLADYLDLVAIGTVADVVPLDKINRTLVEQGLRRIRRGYTRPGVLALLSRAGRVADRITASDIGFAIGPRLNAAGRLDDMTRGIECLLCEDEAESLRLATDLDTLNKQRRSIEQKMREEAETVLADDELLNTGSDTSFGLVLFDENWHQGVIGIVAGRLKEQLNQPVVVFASDGDEYVKGSARSIPGVHIRDVLDSVATHNPDLIDKFGGHAMAAGLTLARSRFSEFTDAFNKEVKRVLNGELPIRELHSDGSLGDADRTLSTATLIADICPWGQEFPAPQFDDRFIVEGSREVGTGHLKLSLRSIPGESDDYGTIYDGIAFNQPNSFANGDTVHVVYALSVNHFRGSRSLQLQVAHIQISES